MANDTVIGLDDTKGLIMDPWVVFNSYPPEVQYYISWFIGSCALFFFIITVASILLMGGAASGSSLQRDASGRNKYVMGILWSVATIMFVIMAVAFAFALFM